MKTRQILLIVLLAVLAAAALYTFLKNDNETLEQATTTQETEYDGPLTLEYLSDQPEWNPTMATTGMERVDPSELTLFSSGLDLATSGRPLPTAPDQPFTLVYADDEHTKEYCAQFGITDADRCPKYGPETYTELAILESTTGEVVHAFKLTNGYSLLATKAVTGYGGVYSISLAVALTINL